MEDEKSEYCLVCGFYLKADPEYPEDNHFYMCACCGFHYGIEDVGAWNSYMIAREEWISEGLNFVTRPNPFRWDYETMTNQLSQLKYARLMNAELNPDYTPEVDMAQVREFWNKFRQ